MPSYIKFLYQKDVRKKSFFSCMNKFDILIIYNHMRKRLNFIYDRVVQLCITRYRICLRTQWIVLAFSFLSDILNCVVSKQYGVFLKICRPNKVSPRYAHGAYRFASSPSFVRDNRQHRNRIGAQRAIYMETKRERQKRAPSSPPAKTGSRFVIARPGSFSARLPGKLDHLPLHLIPVAERSRQVLSHDTGRTSYSPFISFFCFIFFFFFIFAV